MLPAAHFAVALLPVVAYTLVREKRLPSARLVGIVFVGSQFPDLIDKPLAHLLFVIPSGRVFMHSLPFAVPVAIVVVGYAWRTKRLLAGTVFVFAYFSHLAGDHYRTILGPDPRIPSDLFWPILPAVSSQEVPSWAGPESVGIYGWSAVSALVLAVLLYVLVNDVRTQFG